MKIRKLEEVYNPNNWVWGGWHYNERSNVIELFDKQEKYCCVVDLNNLKNASDVLAIILYMKPRIKDAEDFKDMISALEEFKGHYRSFIC